MTETLHKRPRRLRIWLSRLAFAVALTGLVSVPAVGVIDVGNSARAAYAVDQTITNDYPYSGATGGVDPWNFYKGQCTSFAAWRINSRLGVAFTNQYGGQQFGNANHWDDAARAAGLTVSSTPAPGTIAQTDAGSFGHVAWVSRVNSGGTVTVEEYNYGTPYTYGVRTVPASSFKYIYFGQVKTGGSADVYGVLSNRQLTYARIDNASGDRVHGNVVSSASLPFTPKAMATLNFNTILITSTSGNLYRVDVITNNTSLRYTVTGPLAGGWTHDLLTYDGHGHLFGIADGVLRRYDVNATKPTAANITNNTMIGTGFTLNTLTATGANWLLGTTSSGVLLSYRINAASWNGATLRSSGWNFTHLMSPSPGIYLGQTSAHGMYHYRDANPYDFSGSDLQYFLNDPVDTSGWTQVLLSAWPEF